MPQFAAHRSFLSPALPFLERFEAVARVGFRGRTHGLGASTGFDAQRAL